MKIKTAFARTLLLSALALTSCHPGIVVDWFDNTGERILIDVLTGKGDVRRLEPGAKIAGPLPGSVGVIIKHGHGTWKYEAPPPVPARFVRRKNFMVSVITFQVERDGSIYVVHPGTRRPVASFPVQPPGYPLRPKAE